MLIVGLFIRLHTEETLDFQKQKTTNNKEKSVPPLIELFKKHPRNILLALGARLAESVSSNIINAFGIVYISSQLALSRDIPPDGYVDCLGDRYFQLSIGWMVIRSYRSKKVCICREQDFVSCSRFLSSYYWIAKVRSSSGAV